MTTRYRVEYALKVHHRDEFIEWIKALLSVPFVITAGSVDLNRVVTAEDARRRYAEIFRDIEIMIRDHRKLQEIGMEATGRLRLLVPSIGSFFTDLPLEEAFLIEDKLRSISLRKFVSPSFNDVRLILNVAQTISLLKTPEPVQLITFDGDVTLYDDGASLLKGAPMIDRMIKLMSYDIFIAIVTAAGYPEKDGAHYYGRLQGLIDEIDKTDILTPQQKRNLLIMGGEANYMFRFNNIDKQYESTKLQWIDPIEWKLPNMLLWSQDSIKTILDISESVFVECLDAMNIPGKIVRKQHGIGLVPLPGQEISRESLEEVVLSAQRSLQISPLVDKSINFCAFNGGHDVWVDIGDKHLGVLSVRKYLGNLPAHRTLHVGDQFASVAHNDFKARMAACTVWTASPTETERIINVIIKHHEDV